MVLVQALRIIFLLLFVACAGAERKEDALELSIMEVKPDKASALVTQNLLHLNQVYDLNPFLFTRLIRVQTNVPSRPAPILIVNTRYAAEPRMLLAVLLNQQMLRWLLMNRGPTRRALADLRKLYPRLPQDGPGEIGLSPHLRMLASYLEYRALQMYLGDIFAKGVIERLIQDKHFPVIYSQVLGKGEVLEKILGARKLFPKPLARTP
jgi:hypothetical protein